MHAREAADMRAAKVFEGMGVYSPTLGIIGAVLGLMAVMQNLNDPVQARPRHRRGIHRDGVRHRPGQPVLPAGGQQAQGRGAGRAAHLHAMQIEGLIAIAQGENPRIIEGRLLGFLH